MFAEKGNLVHIYSGCHASGIGHPSVTTFILRIDSFQLLFFSSQYLYIKKINYTSSLVFYLPCVMLTFAFSSGQLSYKCLSVWICLMVHALD